MITRLSVYSENKALGKLASHRVKSIESSIHSKSAISLVKKKSLIVFAGRLCTQDLLRLLCCSNCCCHFPVWNCLQADLLRLQRKKKAPIAFALFSCGKSALGTELQIWPGKFSQSRSGACEHVPYAFVAFPALGRKGRISHRVISREALLFSSLFFTRQFGMTSVNWER